jgi:acetoin utilization protein AcuB
MPTPNSARARPSRPPKSLKPLVVRHWMTPSPHSIGKDQPLAVAHRLMTEHGLRHLPVLEHGKLVGILTQRDLYFIEALGNVNPEVERVEEGMSQEVYCVGPEARIEDVAAEMAVHKYGCAVVVEGPKVVGVFTTIDALEVLVQCIQRG